MTILCPEIRSRMSRISDRTRRTDTAGSAELIRLFLRLQKAWEMYTFGDNLHKKLYIFIKNIQIILTKESYCDYNVHVERKQYRHSRVMHL